MSVWMGKVAVTALSVTVLAALMRAEDEVARVERDSEALDVLAEDGGRVGVLLKLHHAMADGMALAQLIKCTADGLLRDLEERQS
mgnify:CR=1 FL=1